MIIQQKLKIIFLKIKFSLGNNTVEPIGVKSNYFGADLAIFGKNFIIQF